MNNIRYKYMTVTLPAEITNALKEIPTSLANIGFIPVQVEQSPSFGNFFVKFENKSIDVTIVRDRGQFHIEGFEKSILENAGLWRSFSGAISMLNPLLIFLNSQLQTLNSDLTSLK